MMDCKTFDDLAELYAAGELARPERDRAERHLAECARCRQRAESARAALWALGAALAPHAPDEAFVERTMVRVRADAAPVREAEDEGPEPLRSRLIRYAALAAAAVLLAMAGYGFLRRGPAARLEGGVAAVLGPNARALAPGSSLAVGDVVATPAHSSAVLALAGGRLRVALAPMAVARVTDPRSGTALQLLRGEMYCRGSGGESAPMVASPLANVAAGPGVVSLHVSPEAAPAAASAGAHPFHGVVTLAAHEGPARVVMPGRQAGPLALQRGQVLALSTDRGRSLSAPVPLDRLRELLRNELRGAMVRHGELELAWEGILAGRHPALMAQVSRRAGDTQDALHRTRSLRDELERRLSVLDRVQAEGPRAFRLVVQPIPPKK